MTTAVVACGKCEMCVANVRYRCVELAKTREASSSTVDVACAKCGETFRVLEYLATFVKDMHAFPLWCDDCRTGRVRQDVLDYDRGYR